MKSTSIFFITILAFILNLPGLAQIKKADKLYKLYNYSEAIPLYLKEVENDGPEKKEATIKLAECFRYTNNIAETRNWYSKVIEMGNPDPISYFHLGQALKGLEMYNEAAEAFKKFSILLPDSLDGEKQYQYCIDLKDWLELPEMAEIKNVESLNTKYSEFCPVDYKSGIVFTSDRKRDMLDNQNYGWTNTNYLDLYYTEPEYSRKYWSEMEEPPKSMARNFNQSYHDGPIAFSADFKQAYITKTVSKNGKKEEKHIRTYLLKIFHAQIENGKKLKYEPFFLNSKDYSVAHPTLSRDNKTIVFSSDMSGGYGGSDLYSCKWEGGKWGNPINLGQNINTSGNEVFPYFANDSVLFFSSNGLMGYGGLDIFQTNLKADGWSVPENLKKPLNSSYDDFGVVFSEDLKEGLFSSDRPIGKGSDDIYAFRNLKHVSEIKTTTVQSNILVSGFVNDKSSGKPLDMATVFVYSPVSDDVHILKTDENGYYEIMLEHGQPYVSKAMKNGFIHDCLSFRSPANKEIKSYSLPRDLLLTKLVAGQAFTVKNIYYDLDKWYIRQDAQKPLDSLVHIMKQYPITAELSSHTDSRASNEYNMELSQKRAEAAVRYIILQGVSPARISAKGYGETKLVNQCADGVKCTEEQHQENRRTEFKITAIDGVLFGKDSFDPDVFSAGDIIKSKFLTNDFFQDCLTEKQSLQDPLLPKNDSLKMRNTDLKTNIVELNKQPKKEMVELTQNIFSDKSIQKESNYRIQLIATKKTLQTDSYFADIKDLISKYGISIQITNTLNKFQLGNFLSLRESKHIMQEVKSRGYTDCFIVKVTN